MNLTGPTNTILKTDALGRVTVTKQRREALLDEFERSGLPGTQFAKLVGVRYPTFAWWAQQRRHQRGDYERAATKSRTQPISPVPSADAGDADLEVSSRVADPSVATVATAARPPLRWVEAELSQVAAADDDAGLSAPPDLARTAALGVTACATAAADSAPEPIPSTPPPPASASLEIILAGGARLCIADAQQLPFAAKLLQLLTSVTLPC